MPTMLTLLLQLLWLFVAATAAYPPPGSCSGNCTGSVHDPYVVHANGSYYRFTTNGRINIATAPSIAGPWTYRGPALPNGSSIDLPGRNDLWAPDVLLVNETYYLTYAVSTIGSYHSDIGVATSTTLDSGSWTDHGSLGLGKQEDWNKIDSNLFQARPNGDVLMTWGSFRSDIWQTELANPPLKVLDAEKYRHLERNTTVRPEKRPPGPVEGSFQFRWPSPGGGDDYFYLFFSSGSCCSVPPDLAPQGEEYKIMVCRSSHATGPFQDREGRDCLTENGGTMVLGSHGEDMFAPGGQGVFFDPMLNEVVMYYHWINRTLGYRHDDFQFGWNSLNFGSGWPVVVAAGEGSQEPGLAASSSAGTNVSAVAASATSSSSLVTSKESGAAGTSMPILGLGATAAVLSYLALH